MSFHSNYLLKSCILAVISYNFIHIPFSFCVIYRLKEVKEAEKAEKREELKLRWEKEKEERKKEKEIKKEEKRLQDEYVKEWKRPRDDLECDNHKVTRHSSAWFTCFQNAFDL